MNRLEESGNRMQADWRRLETLWETARASWHDQVVDAFTRQHWEPLDEEVRDYERALASLIEEIRRSEAVLEEKS